MSDKERNRAVGCLLGLAIGDAMGAPLEFSSRTDKDYSPVTSFRTGGPFNLKAGQWTDDTSQALCLADSLLHRRSLDPQDFMTRLCNWWTAGYNSSTGECFDIGTGTQEVLWHFSVTGKIATHNRSGGNGSIMRLAPIPIAYRSFPPGKVSEIARSSCEVTHGHSEAALCTQLLARVLQSFIKDGSCASGTIERELGFLPKHSETFTETLKVLSDVEKETVNESDFFDPKGYSVTTLVAAVFALLTTSSFQECVLKAVNLCGDSDSVGAVAGQLAGALYGLDQIPQDWLSQLHDTERLIQTGNSLYSLFSR